MTQRFAIYGNRDVDVPTVLHPDLEYPELVRGLVGAWSPCLGNTGGKLLDYSGRGNHGTLTFMDPATDWVVRSGRLSVDCDGSNDYISIPTSVSVPQSSGAISVWFVPTTALSGASESLFRFRLNSPLKLFDGTAAGGSMAFGWYDVGIGDQRRVISASEFATGEMNHLVVTWVTGGVTEVYINGVVKSSGGTTTATWDTTTATASSFAADAAASTSYADIAISDVAIYSTFASQKIVTTLKSLGPGGWAIPRQRRWNALGAAQLAQAAYVVGGGIAVPGGVT